MQGTEFWAPVLNFSDQLTILAIKKRCFGVWPKHNYFIFLEGELLCTQS